MSDKNYKSISEVSDILEIKQHVIRYWDSKFDGLSTRLSHNKRRFFSIDNIKKLEKLKNVLYQNGKYNHSLDLAHKIMSKNIKKKLDFTIPSNNNTIDASDIKSLKKISNNLRKLLY